jgi:serpin B
MKPKIKVAVLLAATSSVCHGASVSEPPRNALELGAASTAINALGLELLGQGTGAGSDTVFSPASLQIALAMTYAGASGETRSEMARVLHYPADEDALDHSFANLQSALDAVANRSVQMAEVLKRSGGDAGPIDLTVANRLFGQAGFEFLPSFLSLLDKTYRSALESLDFAHNAPEATLHVNQWVEGQTRQRIRNVVPPGLVNGSTRLLLVDVMYLKAPWSRPFNREETALRPFHPRAGEARQVPTMRQQAHFGYEHRDGYQVIVVPYLGGELQFLVLLPDEINGLSALERLLTPELLAGCARLAGREVALELPKFRLEPAAMRLSAALRTLGLRTAFDEPKGSADFERMAPRRPNDYLYISEVLHKTFLAVDEQGTEAAAATAVVMNAPSAIMEKPGPIEVRVDHPFLFAIQHRDSGACLFLGRVTEPHVKDTSG